MLFWGIVKCKIDWGSTKADIYAVVMIVGLTDTKISSHQDVTESLNKTGYIFMYPFLVYRASQL